MKALLEQLTLDPRRLSLIDPNADRSAEASAAGRDRANIASLP